MRQHDRRALGLMATGLLVLAACGPAAVSPSDRRPKPSPKGVSLQMLTATTIGPAGGALASNDGRLTLTVPAGAISAGTSITIDEITNTAPGGVGVSYRLLPEGTKFAVPVQLTFQGGGATDLNGLTIAYQEPQGFWLRMRVVTRDAVAGTLSTSTTHFSDWTVVPSNSARDLRGQFRIQNNMGTTPFVATGNAALDFSLEDVASDQRPIAASYYVQWGTISVGTIQDGTATCNATPSTVDFQANIAELRSSPANFLWGVDGEWPLACTGATQYTDTALLVFDTLGIAHHGCPRSFVGTPVLGADRIAGTVLMDCGVDGTVTADFDFVTCKPGLSCSTNPCQPAQTSCDTGVSVCVPGTPLADGTSCGPYAVCSAGACTCTAGASCAAQDACHVGSVSCDPVTGAATCVQTPVADGTSCGQYAVCSAGACTCTAGASCAAQDACHVGSVSCDPVTGAATCVQTPLADGTSCGQYAACSAGVCACSSGASCTAQDACHTGSVACDAFGNASCTQAPRPDGTSCGQYLACSAGACTCTAGVSCPPQDACHIGSVSCDAVTGAPSCDQAPVLDGTSCGIAGETCVAGVCTAP